MNPSAPQPARDPYEVLPEAAPPPLPGDVKMAHSPDLLLEILTSDILTHSLNCVRQFGDFHFAISPRSSLEPLFTRLLTDPICRAIPWKKTHLWLADEQSVDPEDENSCWTLLSEYFGEHAGIPRAQQHRIEGITSGAAARYERELKSALEWRERGHDRLDCVLLAPGADGAVAGLTAASPGLRESTHLVAAVRSRHDLDHADRVTMTLPLINSARLIAIDLPDSDSQSLVPRMLDSRENSDRLPLKGVQPAGGIEIWYILREP